MTDNDRILGYLASVAKHGDIVAAPDHAPSVKLARDGLERDALVRWDYDDGRYHLTSLGRARLSSGRPRPGVVLSFPARAA